jgi:twitching motility protein PilT
LETFVVKINLKDLLKRALMVDAQEVRLVPGRRTVVITVSGENEVRGDVQTPERINAMIEPLMSPEARRSLATGWAEWNFELEGHGTVRATAELKMGLVHASFDLAASASSGLLEADSLPPAPPPGTAPALAPAAVVIQARPEQPPTQTNLSAVQQPRGPVPFNPTLQSMRKLDTVPPAPARSRWDAGVSGGSTAEIDRLLSKMVELKASDLHISTGAPPMIRLDGDMLMMPGERPMSAESVQNVLWPMVPSRNREEFDETHDTDFAHEIAGVARFRSNLFVDLNGMGAVFRVIPTKILSVEQLGLPKDLLSLCNLAKGLVVVTGPTGSGKSTTLAALIDYINTTQKKHIITIEDPVEFVHPNKQSLLNQREVGEHTKSFKRALRAALREDPDIVLLGEMRDLETIAIAMETAETGHLVFGTLHTSSAPSTIDRIIDQFPTEQQNQIRTMLSTSLKGVIAQMLCKKKGGGRCAALEVMMGVPAISNLIREGKIFQIPSVMQTSRSMGMRLMNDSLLELVKAGKVEPDEALSKSNDKSTLMTQLRQAGVQFSAIA